MSNKYTNKHRRSQFKPLIKMIEQDQWSTLLADIKGEIYEGLLKRNALERKNIYSLAD